MKQPEERLPDQSPGLSRRQMIRLAGSAATFTFLQRRAEALPIPARRFLDRTALEMMADRDQSARPPLLVDLQTHVWWRADGIGKMTERGENFLKALAGARA